MTNLTQIFQNQFSLDKINIGNSGLIAHDKGIPETLRILAIVKAKT